MCDASYIPAYDSKGQLGYALFINLNSGAIEAKSCKDTSVSTSAAHVELKAMYLLTLSIIWTRGFLMELGFEEHQPTTISTDSASAQLLATTFQLSSKSQHITMRINAIHQEVVNKVKVIKWIDTEGNTVDVLTKALPVISFERHGFGTRPIQAHISTHTTIYRYQFSLNHVHSSTINLINYRYNIPIITFNNIYTYISFISLPNALILYVLYLPVKPKPISPMYAHLKQILTSSSVQP